jgi:hypothetical protein
MEQSDTDEWDVANFHTVDVKENDAMGQTMHRTGSREDVCSHCERAINDISEELICEAINCDAMYHRGCINDALLQIRSTYNSGQTSSDKMRSFERLCHLPDRYLYSTR